LQRPWARAATPMERLALDNIMQQPDTRNIAGFTPDGTPIVFAANTQAPNENLSFNPHRYYDQKYGPRPDTPDMHWSEINDFLVSQRRDKDEIYKDTLANEQTFAGDIHKAETDLSKATSDKRTLLQQIRGKRAGHKTLHQAVKRVAGNKGNVDCE